MFCSRRNVNMACDVDFISMSRNGHALPKISSDISAYHQIFQWAVCTYLLPGILGG